MKYRHGSHTKYNIQYHFVWATKYRYKVLTGDVGLRVRDLVRQTCEHLEIEILKGVVSKDHVHLLVSAPPNWSVSQIMKRIKVEVPLKYSKNSLKLKNVIGDNIFGQGDIFV